MLWLALVVFVGLTRNIMMLLIRFIICYASISFERKVLCRLGFQLRFPRDREEVLSNPLHLFNILRSHGAVPFDSVLDSIHPLSSIESEPDKNSTSGSVTLSYNNETSIKLFLKFQTGKGMAMWMQALRAAAEPGIVREVDFYTKLAEHVPLRTPKCYAAEKLPYYNVVFVALEHIDLKFDSLEHRVKDVDSYRVTPDHVFDSIDDMRLILTKLATMHSTFLGTVQTNPHSSWIPAKRGLKYCDFVASLGGFNKPPFYLNVFRSLEKYFLDKPLTLVHGDCRPGNMIYVGFPAKEIIFADWEATNAAPLAWDFTYATTIGLPEELRKEHQLNLLRDYHASLEQDEYSLEELQDDVLLLVIVLFYVSYTVTAGGFWSNQGNTTADQFAWLHRVMTALLEIDVLKVSELLEISCQDIQELKNFASTWQQSIFSESHKK